MEKKLKTTPQDHPATGGVADLSRAESRGGRGGLVPKLRFPEFEGNWRQIELEPFLEAYSERVPADTQIEVYSSTRTGLKPQKDYYDGREIINEGEYGVVPEGYFVYRHMSDDETFKFNINSTGSRIAVSKEYPVFKTVNLDSRFLLEILNDGADFKKFAATQRKGGTRTRLYFNNLCSWATYLPSFPEQQKIADCLTSLDEVITAEAQKLDALKAHKKGLMQQLFPAEGESVPARRFPEFRDSGEWEEKRLGDCLSQHPDYGINAPSVPYSENLPAYLRITDISEDGAYLKDAPVSVGAAVTSDCYLDEGDIVLARTGASVGKSYRYKSADGKLVFAGFLIRIRPKREKVDPDFLYHYLATERYWKWVSITSTRSGQPGINGNEYSLLPVPMPMFKEEQHKIADCLSSLDKLIAAQSDKIVALKAQKKGLMQGLFPVVDTGV